MPELFVYDLFNLQGTSMLKRFLIVFLIIAPAMAATAELPARLAELAGTQPGQRLNVWLFFSDKADSVAGLNKETLDISDEALQRRSYSNPVELIDSYDLPVNAGYRQQIGQMVLNVRTESRWLNALSVEVSAGRLSELAELEFIREIRPVITYRKNPDRSENRLSILSKPSAVHSLNYGPSALQVEQIGVPALHDMGLSGAGVLICMLDDGYNLYKTHQTFQQLDVRDTYDFINNDDSVDDPDARPVEGWHGTATLSVLAGYTPGELIGPAYGATLLLAKTEMDYEEIQAEEDFWVAGLEWAERNGARIVNSSLGYSDWYTWEDMDGETAVTTLATIVAEQKGVIVVNSAGNNGRTDAPNTLNAPADGEFVITAGGIEGTGEYWTTASYGPTADGRTKPTVSALGRSAYSASSSSNSGFRSGSGTSFSSPLIAGAIALLLEAKPELTPAQVREAITKTASQAIAPDNYIGYGILNIEAAYNYVIGSDLVPETFFVEQNTPNPFNGFTRIEYGVTEPSRVRITVFDILGREVFTLPERSVQGNDFVIINADQFTSSGVYFYRLEGSGIQSGRTFRETKKMVYIE